MLGRQVLLQVNDYTKDLIKLHDSYRSVFDGPDGRAVLRHICQKAHVYSTTFSKDDPYETARNEGMRLLALSIMRFVYKDESDLIRELEKVYDTGMD